jgi:serine/threonine protein kinase
VEPTLSPTFLSNVPSGRSDNDDTISTPFLVGGSLFAATLCGAGLLFVFKQRRKSKEWGGGAKDSGPLPGFPTKTTGNSSTNYGSSSERNRSTGENTSNQSFFWVGVGGFFGGKPKESGNQQRRHAASLDYISNDGIVDTDAMTQRDFVVAFDEIFLGKRIARGTFGIVHKGTYGERECAVKEIIPDTSDHEGNVSPEERTKLEREATLLARLRHPSLVSFWGYCFHENSLFMVMEYCPTSLEALLQEHNKSNRRLSTEMFLKYLRQFQKGLEYLHKNNIIHRDLKPNNVLLDHQQNLKIIDFGSARDSDRTSKCTSSVGTPYYMAPEVFEWQQVEVDPTTGQKSVFYGKAADMWSFGIIVWRLYTSQAPYPQYEGQSHFAVFSELRKGNVASLLPMPTNDDMTEEEATRHRSASQSLKDGAKAMKRSFSRSSIALPVRFPPILKTLVLKCLAIDPRERYTIVELGRDLKHDAYVASLLDFNDGGAEFSGCNPIAVKVTSPTAVEM